ncbi:hypothetical protein EAH78_13090 [Pseudomonas arsenicoxydans]|uniref:Uncharacterized protein n=1 Tax=Pseudomonas arsenicoxydans TaxID=702115 RepID=A0A502HYP3_9PSED|nr:hypothetical protein EAH78_13090 [Pseudomonas arsenicoxydans]
MLEQGLQVCSREVMLHPDLLARELLVARELAPAGLRSRPIFGGAAHPSRSKLPRHRCSFALFH